LTTKTRYTITQSLLQYDDTIISRAYRNSDQQKVILKTINFKHNNLTKIDQLKKEFETIHNLNLKSMLNPIALEVLGGQTTLVFEDFENGMSLNQLLCAPMEMEIFLNLAIQIAEALTEIHRHHIIHKNLKPQNILFDTITNSVKITGFEIATFLPREQYAEGPTQLMEGALPYMSPEQTGRMNRTIDGRSDLYSLGIIFYQMLTGTLPFKGTDPLEWIYAHVAHAPPLVTAIIPKIPKIIADLISLLLAKEASDRYLTARGLQYDLEYCLKDWRSVKKINSFVLRQKDISNLLIIPQKLYGRELEFAELLTHFKNVVTRGQVGLTLISGYSGIGKSALVNELAKPIEQEHGFFISGKFDQYNRDIPFSTIVQAFQKLILAILIETEEKISEWKTKIEETLGDNAQLVIDVIPQIELIIGKQIPVFELPLTETLGRFRHVFQRFILMFAERKHPLTLFLDDLQWADAASLSLISDLATSQENNYLFIVGTYRDNEVDPSHPLIYIINHLKNNNVSIGNIELKPFSFINITQCLADTLQTSSTEISELAKLVYEKTEGNPFFTKQFMIAIHEENLLYFNEDTSKWQWNLEKIHSKSYTDNVIDLILRKLHRLPQMTLKTLKQLACFGNKVEIKTLAMILNCSEENLQTKLWDALVNSIIVQINGSYQFLHDRLFEATYSLIPEQERAFEHLQLARFFLADFSLEERDNKLFEIVNHLNLAIEIIDDLEGEILAASLNLAAAKKARNATAFKSAANYCHQGQTFLGLNAWMIDKEDLFTLTFSLTLLRAECALTSGTFEETETQLSLLLENARTPLEKSSALKIKIDLLTAKGNSHQALFEAFDCMQLFDIELSLNPGLVKCNYINSKIDKRIQKLGLAAMTTLPLMVDKNIEAAMSVLAGMLPNAYFLDANLHRMIACHMIDLTLTYGVSLYSPMALAAQGFELCGLERYQEGYQYALIAEKLIKHHGFMAIRPQVYNLMGGCIFPWTQHFASAIEFLHQGMLDVGGDFIYSCFSQYYITLLSFKSGVTLEKANQIADNAIKYITIKKYENIADTVLLIQQLIKCLQGKTFGFTTFDDPEFNEVQWVAKLATHPFQLLTTLFHFYKLQSAIFYNDLDTALIFADSTEPLLYHWRGSEMKFEFAYYASLAISGSWNHIEEKNKAQWKKKLYQYGHLLNKWAYINPTCFQHRAFLINAEIAGIENNDTKAQKYYLEAINSSLNNGLIQHAALSYERAAYFYKSKGFDLIADTYLNEALIKYDAWGAQGKVNQLCTLFPKLSLRKNQLLNTTLIARPEQLDLLSVIKASQAISSEIDLDKLITRLLNIVLELSGAQCVKLILSHASALSIEAEVFITADGLKTEILNTEPISQSKNIPISLLRLVQKTKTLLILNENVPDTKIYSMDEYIVRNRPKSILCLPILKGSELFGILYLENKMITGLFSGEKLNALEFIASQAAISLQNAQFYKNLKEENIQRTLAQMALHASQEQLQAIIDSSSTIIYMKDLEGKYLLINRTFENLFNIAKKEIIGKTDFMIFPKEMAETFHFHDQLVLKTNETQEIEETFIQSDKVHTYISIKFPLPNSAGKAYAICGISTDITDRKKIESEKELLLNQEKLALISAQRSIEARDDFISIASHELNTPLTPLKIYLDMLNKALNDVPIEAIPKIELLKKALGKTDNTLDRLTKLTKNLLDVSTITSGQLILRTEEFNLSKLLKERCTNIHFEKKQYNEKISTNIEDDIIGRWDRKRIEQVIKNILSNAIKYGENKEIVITLKKVNDKAILVIRDHGIGIAPIEQNKIFERFERATSIKHYEGLGLELYISNEFIKAHGGTINLQSEFGHGSTFTIELPLNF
jgi:PAS domain S-box-containing protein